MITLAQMRRKHFLTIEERRHLSKLDFHLVTCINSIGEKVCIYFFHIEEINEVIRELEAIVNTQAGEIYHKTGKTVAYTLATFIMFKVKVTRKYVTLKSLPHHKKYDKVITDKQTYLILDNRTGYYKIGRSINPLNREKTLQAEQPEITLICTCGADIERELHKAYNYLKIRGEWFKLALDDVENIKKYFLLKNKEAKV